MITEKISAEKISEMPCLQTLTFEWKRSSVHVNTLLVEIGCSVFVYH